MFSAVKKEPVPYVLLSDRANTIQTIWWLTPMTAEEANEYRVRWRVENEKYQNAAPQRARKTIDVDREQLMRNLSKVDNAGVEGKTVEGADLGDFVKESVDFGDLQELLRAAQSMSELEAGAKK